MLPNQNSSSFLDSDRDASSSFPCSNIISFVPVEPSSQGQPEHTLVNPWPPSVSASDALSNPGLQFPAPIMPSPSTVSPSHTTGTSKSLNDSVRHADFFHKRSRNLSSRQQSLHAQQRVPLRRCHSEADVPSVAAQTSSHFSFSSAIDGQYQEQWRSPQRGLTPVVPSHESAAFSADRGPNTAHSTAIPTWDRRHAGSLHGVSATTHIVTRALPLIAARDRNVSLIIRYPPTLHNPCNDMIPDARLGSSGSVTAPATTQEDFGSEARHLSVNVPEARERAREITESWKMDTNAKAILMFTSVFSPVVASFIIEGYKMLSSDFGGRTYLLTCQDPKELVSSAGGTSVQFQAYSSPGPPPAASIVCVNTLWVMSLVLSITSALFATLKQQWANQYVRLPKVTVAVTLLHLSILLFLVGLVIFFFMIYKTVAIVVSLTVGLIVMVYLMLTILACLDRNSPYRTPLSSVWWST